MDSFDLVHQFQQEYENLNRTWQASYARYQNAQTALVNVLNLFANRDPRFQSAHSEIARVKQALGELRLIEEKLAALLDRVDGDIPR
jgi:hypothetical protein